MKMTKINKPRTKPKALFFDLILNRDINLTNLIVLGKIAAGETVFILIFYQKVPSQAISYKIINIFASLWRGEIPSVRLVTIGAIAHLIFFIQIFCFRSF